MLGVVTVRPTGRGFPPDAAVAAAKGEADANKLISESLTEKVLQSRYIDAIREAGTKGGVIVTDGDAPVIVNK